MVVDRGLPASCKFFFSGSHRALIPVIARLLREFFVEGSDGRLQRPVPRLVQLALARPVLKTPGGVGHKSLSKKSVSHSEKKSVSHYTPGGVCRAKFTFFKAFMRQKSLNFSGACGAKSLFFPFWQTPSGGWGVSGPKISKSQSFTFKKSVSHPPRGGVGGH